VILDKNEKNNNTKPGDKNNSKPGDKNNSKIDTENQLKRKQDSESSKQRKKARKNLQKEEVQVKQEVITRQIVKESKENESLDRKKKINKPIFFGLDNEEKHDPEAPIPEEPEQKERITKIKLGKMQVEPGKQQVKPEKPGKMQVEPKKPEIIQDEPDKPQVQTGKLSRTERRAKKNLPNSRKKQNSAFAVEPNFVTVPTEQPGTTVTTILHPSGTHTNKSSFSLDDYFKDPLKNVSSW